MITYIMTQIWVALCLTYVFFSLAMLIRMVCVQKQF